MIAAILQARMSSSRLPGKIAMPVLGKPMLECQIERLLRSRHIGRLIVATSVDSSDDTTEAVARAAGVDVWRGSLNDVLDRYYQAACTLMPDHVIRVTGDCPLADWEVIDQLAEFHLAGGYDYSSNIMPATWPDGIDAEIMTFASLERAWKEGKSPLEREHVTPYIYRHPDLFRLGAMTRDDDISHIRWTVDYPEDFTFVTAVYENLYPGNPSFLSSDILALMEARPDLADICTHSRAQLAED
jgi:spore coat polysaccharide biosynthesis protein SpsF